MSQNLSFVQQFRGYFVMGVETNVGWPKVERTTTFQGRQITLRPETSDNAPSMVIRLGPDLDEKSARSLLQEFMSGLAWIRGGRLIETFSTITTGGPMNLGKLVGRHIDDSPIEHIPTSSDPKTKLALALYREASSVNVIPYQFLGYFKIINILNNDGSKQKKWIKDKLPLITEHDAVERRDYLATIEPDVADYLYVSGRCAVAHAYNAPVVNPDDPEDYRRLSKDLPLIKALAEHAIETEFGIRSYRAIIQEHLFELEGFRSLFGEETCAELKTAVSVPAERLNVPDRLSLRLQEKPQFPSFEGLRASVGKIESGVVQIHLKRDDGLFEAIALLCFRDERFVFDLLSSAMFHDD